MQGTCALSGNGTGLGQYDGSPGHPNVFQGQQVGTNSIAWVGIPIDRPASGQAHTLRITNIRADASMLNAAGGPVPMLEVISDSPSTMMPITSNPQQTVGLVQPGVTTSVPAAQVFQQCVSQNAALAVDPAANGTPQFHLDFIEGFSAAFRVSNVAPAPASPADQNAPGAVYNTETGFYSSLFPTIPNQGNLAMAGLASAGTRLIARFVHVPAGVKLFANTTLNLVPEGGPPGSTTGVVRMVSTDAFGNGPYAPVAGNAHGLAPMSGSGSTRTAVYEVMQENPGSIEHVSIPIYVAYTANAPSSPGLGGVGVVTGPAPLSNSGDASETDPVPRFAPPTAAHPAFAITSCSSGCGADVSAQTVLTRGPITYSANLKLFIQYVSVQNTSANPIQGPLSLALDGIASGVVLYNPTGFTSCSTPKQQPYLNVNIGSDNVLSPGESAVVGLGFGAASSQAITYGTRVLAGPGNR
jgi:hypothetical protein